MVQQQMFTAAAFEVAARRPQRATNLDGLPLFSQVQTGDQQATQQTFETEKEQKPCQSQD